LKIYIVSAQYIGSITGSVGIHVVDLSRELGKLGYDVTVLSLGIGKNKKEETVVLDDTFNPDPNKRKCRVKVVRFWTKDSKNISGPFEGTKLQEINRLEEFGNKVISYLKRHNEKAVVHLHGHSIIPAIAKELKEKTNFKIVTSIHIFESISEARKGQDGAGAKFIKFMQEKEQIAIKYSDYVIVRSKAVKDEISRLFPTTVKNSKIYVIPSGVSSVFIHHPPHRLEKLEMIKNKYNIRDKLIFNLNKIDPSKGIEYAIEAFDKVKKFEKKRAGNGNNISLVIAGMLENKNEWYLERLQKLTKKFKLENNVSFYIDISEDDKLGLFNLADIFLLPSIIEPFGIPIVEALAKDVPVVAAGVEGPMDIMGVKKVKPPFLWAKGGAIVYYNDPTKRSEYLSEAILAMFHHPKKREKTVEIGKKKVLSVYSWESLVKKKIEIYKKAYAGS